MEALKRFIAENKLVQFLLVGLGGIAIGVIFYPTKEIQEREKTKYEQQMSKVSEEHKSEIKRLNESFKKETHKVASINKDLRSKLDKVTVENKELKNKQKVSYFKLIKPDGTIEIRRFSESEVNESSQAVTKIQQEFELRLKSVEEKWEKIHEQRISVIKKEFDKKEEEHKRQIQELEKSKITEINKKKFGLEIGLNLQKQTYGHVTYDIFGPIFIGLHSQIGSLNTGAGIGIRF
jgi:hypothetical protein